MEKDRNLHENRTAYANILTFYVNTEYIPCYFYDISSESRIYTILKSMMDKAILSMSLIESSWHLVIMTECQSNAHTKQDW